VGAAHCINDDNLRDGIFGPGAAFGGCWGGQQGPRELTRSRSRYGHARAQQQEAARGRVKEATLGLWICNHGRLSASPAAHSAGPGDDDDAFYLFLQNALEARAVGPAATVMSVRQCMLRV